MTYAMLLQTTQIAGVCAIGAGTISMLHLLTIHFRQWAWNGLAQRQFLIASLAQMLGMMLIAFAAGGFFVDGLMTTNQLPLGHREAALVTLYLVLTAAAVVLQVVIRPRLRDMQGAPLAASLGPNDVLAASLSLSGLAAAIVFYVMLLAGAEVLPNPGHLALLTLVLWALLALPALTGLLFRPGEAAAAEDGLFDLPMLEPAPIRQAAADLGTQARRAAPSMDSLLEAMPTPRPVHVPARPAPRPMLARQDEMVAA
jgi:uncharacterized membrane protein HdeD (DUF308 family)